MFLKTQTLEEKVKDTRGNREKTSQLISQFKPFIASVISKKLGRFLEYGVDDELSVGLIAFNEAIESYDIKRGRFLSFARLVITNRLIDFYRQQERQSQSTTSYQDEDDVSTLESIDKKSREKFSYSEEEEERKFEILEYSRELEKWGIDFQKLARVSPRQENLRKEYLEVARIITGNEDLLEELTRTKRLPVKDLEKVLALHRKKIERGRIYIIAVIIAIINNYSFFNTGTFKKK